MNFLGIGPGELFIIMVLALIVFGPNKLPEIGRGLGKAIGEFRRATSEITQEFNRELQLDSILNPTAEPEPSSQKARTEPQPEGKSPATAVAVEEPARIDSSAEVATPKAAAGYESGRAEHPQREETVVPAPMEDLTAVSVLEEPPVAKPEMEPTATTTAAAESRETEVVVEATDQVAPAPKMQERVEKESRVDGQEARG